MGRLIKVSQNRPLGRKLGDFRFKQQLVEPAQLEHQRHGRHRDVELAADRDGALESAGDVGCQIGRPAASTGGGAG